MCGHVVFWLILVSCPLTLRLKVRASMRTIFLIKRLCQCRILTSGQQLNKLRMWELRLTIVNIMRALRNKKHSTRLDKERASLQTESQRRTNKYIQGHSSSSGRQVRSILKNRSIYPSRSVRLKLIIFFKHLHAVPFQDLSTEKPILIFPLTLWQNSLRPLCGMLPKKLRLDND